MLLEEKKLLKSLGYMGFQQGEAKIGKLKLITSFVGSCTNVKIELASIVCYDKKWKRWHMAGSRIACCGSTNNRRSKFLTDWLGFVLRQPGCSACLAMNDDIPAWKYAKHFQQEFEGR
jgi:3-isopropylmalate/(R)-2-methylmalate dehydratase large subunit